jgi:CheY-like chemotaxis protein
VVGRILILEPQPDIRELVRRVAARLGHQTLIELSPEHPEVDAVVVEPESYRALKVAQELRERSPELPIICASIAPPNDTTRALRPAAHLQKPFTLEELQRVLVAQVPASSVDTP